MIIRTALAVGLALALAPLSGTLAAAQSTPPSPPRPAHDTFRADRVDLPKDCGQPSLDSVSHSGDIVGVTCATEDMDSFALTITAGVPRLLVATIRGARINRVVNPVVHDSGWTAAFAYTIRDGALVKHLVRWNPQQVSEVSSYSVSSNVTILGVDADGTVLLQYSSSDQLRLLRWAPQSTVTSVTTPQRFRVLTASTTGGHAAGYTVEKSGAFQIQHPAIWTATTGVTTFNLGTYATGSVTCVSPTASVVMGEVSTATGDTVSVRFHRDAPPTVLSTTPPFSMRHCNDHGQAIGHKVGVGDTELNELAVYRNGGVTPLRELVTNMLPQEVFATYPMFIDHANRIHLPSSTRDKAELVTLTPTPGVPVPTPVPPAPTVSPMPDSSSPASTTWPTAPSASGPVQPTAAPQPPSSTAPVSTAPAAPPTAVPAHHRHAALPALPGSLRAAGGNGCEGSDSFYMSWYDDSRLLRLYLNDNIARLGDAARPESTCTVEFTVTPPQGYTFALESTQHQGATRVVPGDTATVWTSHQLGDAAPVVRTAAVTNSPTFDVTFNHADAPQWAPCGQQSVVTFTLGRHLVRGPGLGAASLGSQARFQLTDALRFAMKPC